MDNKTQDCERLYILGDFFDAWVGDDDDRPLAEVVAAALRAVAARGVKIFSNMATAIFYWANIMRRVAVCGCCLRCR
ncbi:MAG: hypothetical protein R3E67_02565 [Pseudomonadales bacterium]